MQQSKEVLSQTIFLHIICWYYAAPQGSINKYLTTARSGIFQESSRLNLQ